MKTPNSKITEAAEIAAEARARLLSRLRALRTTFKEERLLIEKSVDTATRRLRPVTHPVETLEKHPLAVFLGSTLVGFLIGRSGSDRIGGPGGPKSKFRFPRSNNEYSPLMNLLKQASTEFVTNSLLVPLPLPYRAILGNSISRYFATGRSQKPKNESEKESEMGKGNTNLNGAHFDDDNQRQFNF